MLYLAIGAGESVLYREHLQDAADSAALSGAITHARAGRVRWKVAAVFGGLHTTVALAQVPVWQELKTPYMGAWAAGTAAVTLKQATAVAGMPSCAAARTMCRPLGSGV